MIIPVHPNDLPFAREFEAKLSKLESEFCGAFTCHWAERAEGGNSPQREGSIDLIVSKAFRRLPNIVENWRMRHPRPIIAVSGGACGDTILEILRAGAFDYLDARGAVTSQLQSVMQKLKTLAPSPPCDLPQRLTPAQARVANLLLSNASEREISETLGVSYFTIHNHVKEIYRKCNVHSRVQLVNALRNSKQTLLQSGATLPVSHELMHG